MWGFGFSLTHYLIKKFDNKLEKHLMSLGIGLGLFPITAVTLNLLRIPLHWSVFLILALIVPLIVLSKSKIKISKPKITKTTINILIVILISIIFLGIYVKGANTYPYLEDDDPWLHAESTKYISLEKTAYEPSNYDLFYLDPYPPSFDILMGVLHQTNNSIMWTLKFFNVLIISLGIIFFYFFALQLSKNKNKAILSTFTIAVLPSFMSHFIWAQTLALVLFFPAFYALLKIKENKGWGVIALIIIASILVTQPSSAVIFGIMGFIYWISKLSSNYFNNKKIFSKKNNLIFFSLISGVLLSLLYWIPMFIRWGFEGTLQGIRFSKKLISDATLDTSGGIIYGLKDFIIAPLQSKMDQPTGLGIFIFLILVFTILLLLINIKKVKKSTYLTTCLLWFIFTLIGIEGNAFSIKLFPHRFWVFFAIPVALLVGEGILTLSRSLKNKNVRYSLLSILFIGILWTSAYPKYVVETSNWPAGASWTSYDEINGYLWLKTLPPDTKVFTYNVHDHHIIGLDKYSCSWCKEVVDFRENILEKDIDELYTFLKKQEYKYLIISGMSFKYLGKEFGEEKTKEKINEILRDIQNSTKFSAAHQTKGAIILKVN